MKRWIQTVLGTLCLLAGLSLSGWVHDSWDALPSSLGVPLVAVCIISMLGGGLGGWFALGYALGVLPEAPR